MSFADFLSNNCGIQQCCNYIYSQKITIQRSIYDLELVPSFCDDVDPGGLGGRAQGDNGRGREKDREKNDRRKEIGKKERRKRKRERQKEREREKERRKRKRERQKERDFDRKKKIDGESEK